MLKIIIACALVLGICLAIFRDNKGNNRLNRDIDYTYLKRKKK